MVTVIPQFRSGDSFLLEFDLDAYPASEGWTLEYSLRGPSAIDVSGSIQSDLYQVSADPETTNDWAVGDYLAFVVVSLGSQKATIELGKTTILPSLTGLAPFDTRSHVKKVLDALESLLESKASKDVDNYTIANRSLTKLSPDELLKWQKYYRSRYVKEQNDLAIQTGNPPKNRVLASF